MDESNEPAGEVQDPAEPYKVENDNAAEPNAASDEDSVEDGNQDVVDIHPESVENLNVIREDESDRLTLGDAGEDTPQPEQPVQDQSAGQPPTTEVEVNVGEKASDDN